MVLKDAMPLIWYTSTKKNTANSIFELKEAGTELKEAGTELKEAGTELLGGKTQRAEILVPPR
jgi:hypothetical protein